METITTVYICKIKILGFGFAVLTQERADAWVAEDPESHYYETVPVRE